MVDLVELLAAIGIEALFQSTRADPRLVATNADRRTFTNSAIQIFVKPTSAIGLLQLRHAVGFAIRPAPPAANGTPAWYDKALGRGN